MTRSPLPALLALALLALAACTPPIGPGRQMATGPGEGGIGGTGLRPDEEGGLGGTGVFGTITGFGSIRLNGLRVEIPADLATQGLAVGDTVAVEAIRDRRGLVARRVTPLHPLVGPIDRVEGGQLSVMGTTVTVGDGAVLADGLRVGDRVEVSGIWRSGTVVATRVTRARPDATAQVAGLLLGDGTRRTIGGTAVDLGCCAETVPGFAAVRGRYDGGSLVAEDVTAGTSALFAPSVRWLVVEAFLARNPADPGFHLSGFGIPMDPASPVPPSVGQRSVFVGRLDQDFLIERSYALPEGAEARLRALDGIGADTLLE
jgi:hypothetical protein